jgi:tRNA(fMet)-specific endonuclease VapC
MSLLLLDTTFLIDAERGGVDLDDAIADDDDVAISAVTVAELIVGGQVGLSQAAESPHVLRRRDHRVTPDHRL